MALTQQLKRHRKDNRWIAGTFSVEFHISSKTGQVTEAKITQEDIRERRTLNEAGDYVLEGGAPPREAVDFDDCIHTKLLDWVFEPPPEVDYVHTYSSQIGEAW